jgi:periplasmic protein TonB
MVETQSFDAGIGVQEAELAPDVVAAEAVPPVGAAQQPAVQVSVPRYDLNPPPHYPRVARRRKYTGIVTLNVRVTADGRVAQVRIADSSGYAVLDRSAAISVKAWQFTPARRGGLPVAMWVRVPVRYELR